MAVDDIKHWLMGAAVVSLIGGILLMVLDFGWWYNYGPPEIYGWIGFQGFEDGNFTGIIFVFVAFLLLYTTAISILALVKPDQFEPTRTTLQIGLLAAIAVFIIVLIGGIVFEINFLIEDVTNWGLAGGFYGGIIASPATAFFLYMCLRKIS